MKNQEKLWVIVVDDNHQNLNVAKKSVLSLTNLGVNIYLTDDPQNALEMLKKNEENTIVGAVIDLYFPRDSFYCDGYESYLHELQKVARSVLESISYTKKEYPNRINDQLYHARRYEQLPFGGGLAQTCVMEKIPFIIITDSHRHCFPDFPFDTATLLTPFYNWGFLKDDELTEKKESLHVMWGISKERRETWERAFANIAAQWKNKEVWRKLLGVYNYRNQIELYAKRNSELLMKIGHLPLAVHGKVIEGWRDSHKKKDFTEQAKKIVSLSGGLSKYTKEDQIKFIRRVLVEMHKMKQHTSVAKLKSVIGFTQEVELNLPSFHWDQVEYRPDLGIVAAVSKDYIDARRIRADIIEYHYRNEVFVWKIKDERPKIIFKLLWWDYSDDLESPHIKQVSTSSVTIELFEYVNQRSRIRVKIIEF